MSIRKIPFEAACKFCTKQYISFATVPSEFCSENCYRKHRRVLKPGDSKRSGKRDRKSYDRDCTKNLQPFYINEQIRLRHPELKGKPIPRELFENQVKQMVIGRSVKEATKMLNQLKKKCSNEK